MLEELKTLWQNPWVRVVAILFCVFIFLFVNNKMMVEKTADRVIEKLKKDYVPGPYAPGFDPDKVNPDLWKSEESALRNAQWRDEPKDNWKEDWEAQRHNHSQ